MEITLKKVGEMFKEICPKGTKIDIAEAPNNYLKVDFNGDKNLQISKDTLQQTLQLEGREEMVESLYQAAECALRERIDRPAVFKSKLEEARKRETGRREDIDNQAQEIAES